MDDSRVKNNDLRFELIADSSASAAEDPMQFVRRKLRGRYRLTILLGVLFALCGSIVGYSAAPVKYESTGLIRFKPALPTILYPSAVNQLTPLFDSFVSAQAMMIRNRITLQEAIKDAELMELDWPQGPEGIDLLQSIITVNHRRGEQVVSVTATHRDPVYAQIAVNSVLRAFNRSYLDPSRLSPTVREEKLVAREQKLQSERQAIGEQILIVSDQYGADTIMRLHSEKIHELIASDQKLTELNLALTALKVRQDHNVVGPKLDPFAKFDSIASILKFDGAESIETLRSRERSIITELESIKDKFGPKHPRVRELNQELESLNINLSLQERAFADVPYETAEGTDFQSAIVLASIERIEQITEQYRQMRERLRVAATELGNRSVLLRNLQEQEKTIKIRLAETRQALDVLRVENDRDETARIIVAALGNLPSMPATDRRQAMAMAAALFGAGVAGCLVVMIGIFDPRCRYAQELQAVDPMTQVISLIPDLSVGCKEIDELAALGVHQLRNLLELQRNEESHTIYTITSPGRREGKTSLVLALGASFAVAGRKTLIIDADVTRAGLTHELEMDSLPGLCEAIGLVNRGGEIHQTDSDNLWCLPVGDSTKLDSRSISRDKLLTLLDAIRDRFDIIIFDTGSVMTSLEASLVSSISDRVIMAVARNQHVEQIKASLERLRRIGTECTGLVFNLAPASDFDQRDWHISQTSTHAAPLIPETPSHYGNLVDTIGSISPISRPQAESESVRKAA